MSVLYQFNLNRNVMGLPAYYVPRQFQNLEPYYLTMTRWPEDSLINFLNEGNGKLEERFVAAQLLALIGDNRIQPLNPCMIDVPTDNVEIGLDNHEVDRVINDFSDLTIHPDWILKEVPKFTVHLNDFRIAQYPVTNKEYLMFMSDSKFTEFPTSWEHGFCSPYHLNHPVYSLSIDAVESYIVWLSEKTGHTYRLPSEYEWEYVAGGILHFQYPWGNKKILHCANTAEEKIYTSTPIGIFEDGKSPFGVYDMAGNVEEYVADNYKPYLNGKYIIDDLSIRGEYRITRGGCFARYLDLARTSRRHGRYPSQIFAVGFRLAESV